MCVYFVISIQKAVKLQASIVRFDINDIICTLLHIEFQGTKIVMHFSDYRVRKRTVVLVTKDDRKMSSAINPKKFSIGLGKKLLNTCPLSRDVFPFLLLEPTR